MSDNIDERGYWQTRAEQVEAQNERLVAEVRRVHAEQDRERLIIAIRGKIEDLYEWDTARLKALLKALEAP